MRWLAVVSTLALSVLLIPIRAEEPPAKEPEPPELAEIAAKAGKLQQAMVSLKRQGVRDPYLAEIEIYHKAAEWTMRHQEFFQKETLKWTIEALNRGLLRANQQAAGEAPWLNQTGHSVVRAYRSGVDGSVQPYAVTFPKEYGRDRLKQWRLDVVLHGRNAKLSEVSFLHTFNGDKPSPDRDYVQIDIYGRGNNAYRWAGETDVLEAINHFLAVERLLKRDSLLDPKKLVLRSFSMGGAGTWHLGLHHPGRWTAIGPGAGFTTTHGYISNLPEKLPPYQEACLSIYDAVDYAENAFNVPIVAYGGSKDKQLQASKNIQAKLKPLEIPMTLLIGEGLAHKFPPEWQDKAEAEYQKHLKADLSAFRPKVRFVTYTMKYPSCDWVEILGLEKHYQRSLVDAEQSAGGFKVKTENIRALHLGINPLEPAPAYQVEIDGQTLQARPYLSEGEQHIYLMKADKKWKVVLPEMISTARLRQAQKVTGLQGPIDDAFTSGFLCVYGTGKPWNTEIEPLARISLKRFQAEWDKYLRGALPVKADHEVTPEDIATKHLILFGDPSSNSLLGQVADSLPLKWTKDEITLAGKTGSSKEHLPVMIYPSPLSTNHYVVLNSGHTFHAKDFQGTNALLYPRLGDYALLKMTPTQENPLEAEVVTAGLFDDFWRLPE